MILTISLAVLLAMIVLALVDSNKSGFALTTLFFGGLIYHYTINSLIIPAAWAFICLNPGLMFTCISAYFLIGLMWSFFKWFLHVKKEQSMGATKESCSIQPKYYTDTIVTWMAYWPFSVILFILHDALSRFYKWIYSKVSGVYEKITSSVFA